MRYRETVRGTSFGGIGNLPWLRGRARPRRALLLLAGAIALALLEAVPAQALSVSTARVRFQQSRYGDKVDLRGTLEGFPQSIEQFASVRIDIGTFSETIDSHRFRQRAGADGTPRRIYSYLMDSARRRQLAPGIRSMTLDFESGRFRLRAQYLALTRATNPMPFRLVAGTSDRCVMLQFAERPFYRPLYDRDENGRPIPETRRTVVDGSRRGRWTFLRDATQPSCDIKDLEAQPRGFSVNRPVRLRVEARVGSPSVQAAQLFEVDHDLQITRGPLCDLRDDGTGGDDVAGDRVHSCRVDLFEHEPRGMRLIARGSFQGREVLSPTFDVDVVPEVLEQDAAVFLDHLVVARDIWGAKLGDLGNTATARQQTAQAIRQLPFVRDVAYDDQAFLIQLAVGDTAGILGVLPALGTEPRHASGNGGMSQLPAPPPIQTPMTFALYENANSLLGQAAERPEDHRVENSNVLVWAPFYERYFPNDDLNDLRHRFATNACPRFQVRLLRDEECTLQSLRRFADHGTIILATEGFYPVRGLELVRDRLFEKDPVFATGESVSPARLVANVHDMVVRYYVSKIGIPGVPERRSPRLTLYYAENGGRVVWGVKPSYVADLPRRLPGSVVFAGFRNSSRTLGMAQAFLGGGASAYLGFSGNVHPPFVRQSIAELFGRMLDQQSVGEAFAALPQQDPDSGSSLQFHGDARPTYVGLAGLFNGDFEKSTLASWEAEGDGRVLSVFGPYSAREGTFMGVLSTGLGDLTQGGVIRQTACVPEGRTRLAFDWNFISAEFRNWCHQGFDDRFVVRVDGTWAWERSVDDLCDGALTQLHGLELNGPGEDVFATGWRSASVDISPFTGGGAATVDVEFAVVDDGGSVVDTVVLLDRIRFE